MAFTKTVLAKGVMGDMRYESGTVANTGTTGTVTVGGITKIYGYSVTNLTTVDKGVKAVRGTGTNSNVLTITINSSDNFDYWIFGK